MPAFKAINLVFFIYFFIGIPVRAQFKFDKAVLISKENGLPVNDIRCLKKGSDGFVWIGTGEGLCRFDGQLVKTFQTGSDLRHSLFENFINTILPIKNFVWMGTSQGVSVFNTKDNTFRHYQFTGYRKADSLKRKFDQNVAVLYSDRSGTVWIGTRDRGLCMYDEGKDDFRFFSFSREKYPLLKPSLGADNAIISIVGSRTNDSIVWAGTPGGLQQVNKYTGNVKLYTFPQKNKDYQVALNAFRRLYHHDDGLLYVGSWAAGVNVFDPGTETFTPLQVKNKIEERILNSPISNMTRKSDHEIWITSGTGLAVYDTKLKDVTWTKFNNGEKNEFYAIDFIDEANRVWHQTMNGVQYFDPTMQQFARYSFKSLSSVDWAYAFYILSDKSGNNITVCPRQTDGIYHFDKLKKEWTKTLFPHHETFKKEIEAIRSFVQLPSGDYIISADNGIFLYSEKNKKLAAINRKLPFAFAHRREILLDHSGYIWLANDAQGLIKWDPATNNYTDYKIQLPAGDTSNPIAWLNHLFEDRQGNIWFQTSKGLGVYDAGKDSILIFIYSKNETNSFPVATSFADDKKGRVWVSGGYEWIGYALTNHPEKGIVYKLNTNERGISGDLYQLATDRHGEVWGYTLKELVKINADDLSFTTYSFQYSSNEADFFHFSFLPSGEIIFGGRNDITIANPAELKRNKEIPVPYIAGVEVLNQPFNFIQNGSPLKLKYNQNFFSIGFSARAFTMSKDVKFRYRLNGFDDWTEATSRRFANYTNVPGGDYIFQLRVANNEGMWNPKILELPVHIDTAFWLTWWFRSALIIIFVIAVYSLYRYRVGQLKKKQKLKSEYEKKLANVEMSALLAQMNPHFLFNSLNSIDSYIIRNESKKASEYLNNFARLMRLILQNSRSNYISLKDELEALELYLQMESLRFKNKFSYAIDVDEKLDVNSIVIPPMLIQPYVENAIWHGLMHKTNGEEGKVELGLYKNEDNLLCIIRDNGIGRKKSSELKEQKLNNRKRSMGMQITEDRIEIINKLYSINASVHIYDMENEQGESKGTRVELTIPV
jgi:ligand-binding sensor domain-containing protein/two-component sensor histidine kinase